MSSRSSFSLGRAVSSAFASLPAAWNGAWAVLFALWGLLSFHPILSAGGTKHYSQGLALDLLVLPVVVLGAAVLQLMTSGALYRIALFGKDARQEGLGFGGIQLAMTELRLLIAELIVSAFRVLIMSAVLVVFVVSFNTVGMMEGHTDTGAAIRAMIERHQGVDWVFIGLMVAAGLLLIFVGLKFSLFRAATTAERKIVTLNALGLSSGSVGKLFAGLLLFFVPFLVLSIAVMYNVTPQAKMSGVSFILIAQAAIQAAAVFLVMPLVVGFLSSAYRQIVALRAK